MKKIMTGVFMILLSLPAIAQKASYSKEEIRRIADMGRIWGMVNYFHPAMGSGKINTADLVVKNAASLANDPSAENFKVTVNNMLAQLNDPSTNMLPPDADSSLLFVPAKTSAAVHKFSNGYWYVAFPTVAMNDENVLKIPGLLPNSWDSARGIILDLRNKKFISEWMDNNFLYNGLPLIEQVLPGDDIEPYSFERIVFHNGFVPQEDGQGNIYYSGWRTSTNFTPPSAPSDTSTKKRFSKPLAIVINNNTSFELIKRLYNLRFAGKCLIIFEGNLSGYPSGAVINIPVADGNRFQLRKSDLIFGGNNSAPRPDIHINKINDFSESGSFLSQCFRLLDKGLQQTPAKTELLSQEYHIPVFTDSKAGFTVSTGERLFALFNYWNAIQYFYPYKKLLVKDWNNILEEHLPQILTATDSIAYHFALRDLISEIHDCHGFFYSIKGITPLTATLGYSPPFALQFIDEKLYVTAVGKDSLPGKDIRLWDEVILIDGIPITAAMNKWRTFIATSNESTFKRDIVGYLIKGPIGSTLTITIKRNGKLVKQEFTRSGKFSSAASPTNFNLKYPAFKMLANNTGYVNMGQLTYQMIDSMFTAFKDTRAIIFDIRNYPKGTAWGIAPRLAAKKEVAVKFEMPIVTADYITGGESVLSALSYFTVEPDTSKPRYKGKVIMLCNATTQSQAEYTIMMFQGAMKTTVIGSQTAGADGNVSTLLLPGTYRASFSGLNVLYPDGGQTQRTGIRIDIPSKPSVAGLMAGKDEVMERAMKFLDTGK